MSGGGEVAQKVAEIDPGVQYPGQSISASLIGDKCDAYLALSLRGFPSNRIDHRTKRIFRTGHRKEDEIVEDLRAAGYQVWPVDPMTGKQFTYTGYEGHAKTKVDGHILLGDELCLLEVKSMNDRNFKQVQSKGVRFSHPKYWAQVQMSMGLSGFKRTLFFARNKNDEHDYDELIDFEEVEWSAQRARIETVLRGEVRRIAQPGDKEYGRTCNWCSKSGVCQFNFDAPVTCQSCAHSTPDIERSWWCRLRGAPCDAPCASYVRYQPGVPA